MGRFPDRPAVSRREARVMAEEPSELSNLREAGDPVIGNPFPPNNSRHEIWNQATLEAEEENCQLTAQLMRQSNDRAREGFWAWYQRGGGNLHEFKNWVLDLHTTRFNIWAKRTCRVVLNENDLRAYDCWLSDYAKGYLNLVTASRTVRDWPTGTCPIPAEFQSILIERVNYWKAAARGFLRIYRAEVKKLTQNSSEAAQSVDRKPTKKQYKALTDREQKIWEVIQRGVKATPPLRGTAYCREVDAAKVSPPRKGIWQDGPRTYVAAYKSGDTRLVHWIQNEKSKVRRKAELAGHTETRTKLARE